MNEYKLVCGDRPHLEEHVPKYMNEGWHLQGSAFFVQMPGKGGYFCQPMWRFVPKEKSNVQTGG